MQSILNILETRISKVLDEVSGQKGCSALVRPATDARFGDYQVNGVMPLAKKLKINPGELAKKILAKLKPCEPNLFNQLDQNDTKLNFATTGKLSDICQTPEIAGAGFINLRLKTDFVVDNLLQISRASENFGIEQVEPPKTIVVDFSAPNIAKEMHVGHLRSTIIGDCICRLLEFQGNNVIRQNHIGDWGTALGKVILGLWHMCMAEKRGGKPYYENDIEDLKLYAKNKQELKNVCNRIHRRHEEDWEEDFIEWRGDGKKHFGPFLSDLKNRGDSKIWEKITILYQYVNLLEESLVGLGLMTLTRVKKKSYNNSKFLFEYISIPYETLSRHITSMMQKIDDKDNEQEKKAWALVRRISIRYCQKIYKRLNVKLKSKDIRGESYYRKRKRLVLVVKDLRKAGLATESEGAICVFPEGFKTKEGDPLPFIIQKSDEAYLYATTDLAALRYRVTGIKYEGETYKVDEIIYVTDARQKQHFQMLFKVAEMANWAKQEMLHHVMFGSVLGEDGKPLKTRSGENVKLKELLDEAIERARKVVEEKNPGLSEDEKKKIANAVGIGAVKYADYTNNRTSDYIFSFDKMLAMEGNTAPYMQYAYARVRSIQRKGRDKGIEVDKEIGGLKAILLTEPSELDLAKHLIRYGEAVSSAVIDYRPNYLTAYLYDLAQKFSSFYNDCPVLDASADKRPTRLLLCDLTAKTIEHGLHNLLGIEVIEQM
jgi:arginyl-tRNA synthetase